MEAVEAGHVLGNHTMSHNGRIELKALVQEIEQCDALIKSVYERSGKVGPSNIPFRLPYGIRAYVAEYMESGRTRHGVAMDPRITALASMGRCHAHWTCILPDWEARCAKDVERLFTMAVDHARNMERQGLDVVFAMHDGCQKSADVVKPDRTLTVQLVDRILTEAKERKWDLWTLGLHSNIV
jgi:peptidoglycan/xylan/chitin deacetylase (PgdA/CDA1 family)